ncbi:MAG: hypothetical protein HC905_03050 [Bacteroidales bacterium]|nr:hypothetical protein [Bacteroidales bacterium]
MSHVKYNANQSTVQVKRYYYKKENTPMVFRCFLTFSTKEDFSNTKYTDNQFWITDIVSSNSNLPIAKADKFYIKKTTGFGRFMGCTTILALITIPVILGVNATTPD